MNKTDFLQHSAMLKKKLRGEVGATDVLSTIFGYSSRGNPHVEPNIYLTVGGFEGK